MMQRRAVLRRLRQEAGRGFGPPLPLLGLALALCADRVRSGAGTGAALVRLHPAVTLLPGAFVAAMMTLFVLASAGRPVDFTPRSPAAGLAVSSGSGGVLAAGSVSVAGRPQGTAARELFTDDDPGPVYPDGWALGLAEQSLGQGAHARHAAGKDAVAGARSQPPPGQPVSLATAPIVTSLAAAGLTAAGPAPGS